MNTAIVTTHIDINGEITHEMAARIEDEIRRAPVYRMITLMIKSEGGSSAAAERIITAAKSHPGGVYCFAATAHSAACDIFLAIGGSIHQDGTLMTHLARTPDGALAEYVNKRTCDRIMVRTGLTCRKTVLGLLEDETVYNADRAVAMKLAMEKFERTPNAAGRQYF